MKYLFLALFAVLAIGASASPTVEISFDSERVVVYEGKNGVENIAALTVSEDSNENEKDTLEKLKEKLRELAEKLRKDGKELRARLVERYIRGCDYLMKKLEEKKLDQTKFADFVRRVRKFLEKQLEKEPESELVTLLVAADDVPTDDEEENKDTLEKLKEKLRKLAEKLRKDGKELRARLVERYIRACDYLMKKLEEKKLDQTKFAEFVRRVRKFLEKQLEKEEETELVSILAELEDNEDVPAPGDEEDNKDTLEKLKEKLRKLAEKLRKDGKELRARLVERYIRACDYLLKKLQEKDLDESKLAEFVRRVRKFLEKHLEKEEEKALFSNVFVVV